MFYAILAIMVTAVALLIYNHDAGELFGLPIENVASVALMSSLLLYLVGGRFASTGSALQSLKQLAIWVLVGFGLILGYSFKDDAKFLLNRVAGELVPGMGVASDGGAVTFRRSGDGHFTVFAELNGREIPMLVDSGASTVVLSYDDAQKVGINPDELSFTSPVMTANGRALAASIRLGSITVGGIRAERVSAMVSQPGALKESLLGMSFLDKLGGWSVSGDRLTLLP